MTPISQIKTDLERLIKLEEQLNQVSTTHQHILDYNSDEPEIEVNLRGVMIRLDRHMILDALEASARRLEAQIEFASKETATVLNERATKALSRKPEAR